MDKRTKPIPEDFTATFDQLALTNNHTANVLRRHYNVSYPIIYRWCEQTGRSPYQVVIRAEEILDMDEFKRICESGRYTVVQIANVFDLRPEKVSRLCKRNNIKLVRPSVFNPHDPVKFVEYIETNGKMATARKYNTTIQKINGWLVRNNIVVESHIGNKKSTRNVRQRGKEIEQAYNDGESVHSISKRHGSNIRVVREVLECRGIDVVTTFDKWRDDRRAIDKMLPSMVEDNQGGKTLKEIAEDRCVSYELLKSAWKESGLEVKLHGYGSSAGETEMLQFVQSLSDDARKIRLRHNGRRYELDVFIEDRRIAIEYCGEYWHSDINLGRNYHKAKREWCEEQGICLITVFEHEWHTKRELIESMISTRLGFAQTRLNARDMTIIEISNQRAKEFHNNNHVSGGVNAAAHYGLAVGDDIYSVISVSKPRWNANHDMEIVRFSSRRETIVRGGFSKLFKHVLKEFDPSSVLAYCDLRFGTGGVYNHNGFEATHDTVPNYWYYDKRSDKEGSFESRQKYQKSKLSNFPEYDSKKTERQIMLERGYYRIFDCGSRAYVWTKKGA